MSNIVTSSEYTNSCEKYLTGWDGKWGFFHWFIFQSIVMLVLGLIISLITSIIIGDNIGIAVSVISLLLSLWINKIFWYFVKNDIFHQVLCTSGFINKYVPNFMYSRLFIKPTL